MLDLLHGDMDENEKFGVKLIDPTRQRPGAITTTYSKRMIADAVADIESGNRKQLGAYVTICALKPDTGTNWDSKNFSSARWLCVDADDEQEVRRVIEKTSEVDYTFAVQTGTQPTQRVQFWFRLAEPLRDRKVWGELQERMSGFFQTDTISDAARVMRVPGMVAWPKPHKEGRVAELIKARFDRDHDPAPVTPDLISNVFSGSRRVEAIAEDGPEAFNFDTGSYTLSDLMEMARRSKIDGKWWQNVRAIVASLARRGAPDFLIHTFVHTHGLYQGVPGKDEEVQGLIDDFRKRKDAPHPSFEEIEPADSADLDAVAWRVIGELQEPDYFIKHWLAKEAFAVLYGEPGAGKTFVVLDMALHIAQGRSWYGSRVREGRVLYVAAEGGNGLRRRLRAAVGPHADLPPGFCVLPVPIFLDDPQACARLDQFIEDQGGFDLIVFDTLARSMTGDENLQQDMGRVITAADALRKKWSATVLLVHHTGKDAARGARGSSALLGGVDTEIALRAGAEMTVKMHSTKQKEDEGLGIELQLEKVILGTDSDGDDITSLKVKGTVSAAKAEKLKALSKEPLTGNAKAVFDALVEFVLDNGKPNPGGSGMPEPGSVQVVDKDDFSIFARGFVTGDNAAAKRASVSKALATLRDRGTIQIKQNKVWPTLGGERN